MSCWWSLLGFLQLYLQKIQEMEATQVNLDMQPMHEAKINANNSPLTPKVRNTHPFLFIPVVMKFPKQKCQRKGLLSLSWPDSAPVSTLDLVQNGLLGGLHTTVVPIFYLFMLILSNKTKQQMISIWMIIYASLLRCIIWQIYKHWVLRMNKITNSLSTICRCSLGL